MHIVRKVNLKTKAPAHSPQSIVLQVKWEIDWNAADVTNKYRYTIQYRYVSIIVILRGYIDLPQL